MRAHSIFPTAACLPGSRGCTCRSSIGRSTAPRRPTPSSTRSSSTGSTTLADFPLYPLNGIAHLNAFLGGVYVHSYSLDDSLAPDPSKSPSYQGKHGDTHYYFFETPDLPLFGPLRTLGVPEPLIDVVEPFFREVVELGYDRSIPPWEPTPARLIPTHDPATVAADLARRDRRGDRPTPGPPRLATAAEHSRGAAPRIGTRPSSRSPRPGNHPQEGRPRGG